MKDSSWRPVKIIHGVARAHGEVDSPGVSRYIGLTREFDLFRYPGSQRQPHSTIWRRALDAAGISTSMVAIRGAFMKSSKWSPEKVKLVAAVIGRQPVPETPIPEASCRGRSAAPPGAESDSRRHPWAMSATAGRRACSTCFIGKKLTQSKKIMPYERFAGRLQESQPERCFSVVDILFSAEIERRSRFIR